MFLSAVLISLTAALTAEAAVLSTQNTVYANWQPRTATDNSVQIPVYIEEASYTGDTSNCLANIRTAIANVNRDMAGCITFSPVQTTPVTGGLNYIQITARHNGATVGTPGTLGPYCTTFPGRALAQNNNGQRVLIGGLVAMATHNCCAVRDVMRYLANVLGLRNEYLRPDRQWTVTTGNIDNTNQLQTTAQPYNVYTATSNAAFYQPAGVGGESIVALSNVANPAIPMDYNSITMVPQNKFGLAGANVWVPLVAGPVVGVTEFLSQTDCRAIRYKYQCTSTCPLTLPA